MPPKLQEMKANENRRSSLIAGILLALSTLGLGATAFANDIESCNSSGRKCIVTSRELITGDRVGIFSSNDRLVAYGRVQKMAGTRRIVAIDKSFGSIDGDEKVKLLNNISDPTTIQEIYSVERSKSRKTIDASFGAASYSIGSGAGGFEASGGWIKRGWKNFEYVGRGVFASASGEIAQAYVLRDYLGQERRGTDVRNFAANVYGGLGGLGYTLFGDRTMSLRGEIGGGLAYVTGVIGQQDMTQGTGFDTKLHNGFGFMVRGNATALLNLSSWQIGVSLGQSSVQDATATIFGLNVAKSL